VLTGANGIFCAGADLKAVAGGRGNNVTPEGDGPLGCTRLLLSKPVIAAVEGYAVAGGLELALWCDPRVAAKDAVFGVFCRRFGVPLVDGGTVRLPRLIGMSHALDMILTGRGVAGDEAFRIGLANRLVEPGQALAAARDSPTRLRPSHRRVCARTGCPHISNGQWRCRKRSPTNIATVSRRFARARPSRVRAGSPPVPAAMASFEPSLPFTR
jgi:enoyl-CoA hydratase/carnithine racemase